MKLKKLLEMLEGIKDTYGENLDVVMADNISIVEPVVMDKYPDKRKIIITDEKLKNCKLVILKGNNI